MPELGLGDDVVIPTRGVAPRWQYVLRLRHVCLAGAVAVFLWFSFAPGILSPRLAGRRELLRALCYGSVPASILGGGMALLAAGASSDPDPTFLLAPRELACAGGGVLLGLALTLAVRLSCPLAEEEARAT